MAEINLFAYGTLQEPSVIELVIGLAPPASSAVLEGHARFGLKNAVYPAVIAQPGARVSGVLYTGLTSAELAGLDEYEGPLYERRDVLVTSSGASIAAFVYVLCERHRHLLSPEAWDFEHFRREHLASYLARIAPTKRAP